MALTRADESIRAGGLRSSVEQAVSESDSTKTCAGRRKRETILIAAHCAARQSGKNAATLLHLVTMRRNTPSAIRPAPA
jgi:hypothetical protein